MVALLAFVLMIVVWGLLIAVCMVFDGFVLSVLWNWFMPAIFGLPVLNIPLAIGFMLVLSYAKPSMQYKLETKKEKQEFWTGVILKPFLLLLIGWIVKTYFM